MTQDSEEDVHEQGTLQQTLKESFDEDSLKHNVD